MTADNRIRIQVLVSVAVLIVMDQITKLVAMDVLRGTPARTYLSDMFRFVYAENTGVFLGLGRGLPESVRFWLFTLAVGAILGAIFFDTMRSPTSDRWRLSAISMILAGGLGNLVDRVIRDGAVVDFMNMGIGGLRTGIFNVADVLITTGALMFLTVEILAKPAKKNSLVEASESTAPPAVE